MGLNRTFTRRGTVLYSYTNIRYLVPGPLPLLYLLLSVHVPQNEKGSDINGQASAFKILYTARRLGKRKGTGSRGEEAAVILVFTKFYATLYVGISKLRER